MSIHSVTSNIPLSRYKKMTVVTKSDVPQCMARFKKNAKVYFNRFTFLFTHRCLITNKKMINKIISNYANGKSLIKNGKGTIDIRKTDQVFKGIYKTTNDKNLKKAYKKIKHEYEDALKKNSDTSSSEDSQSSQSNSKSPDKKSQKSGVNKPAASETNPDPQPVSKPIPSLVPDIDPIPDTTVPNSKAAKKPAPKPKRKIKIKPFKPERTSSSDKISPFEDWQTNNADYGHQLDGPNLIAYFRHLLDLEPHLKKTEVQEFNIVKESFVSSLDSDKAIELYEGIEEEEIKNFIKQHNRWLSEKNGVGSGRKSSHFIPSNVDEMKAYIDILDFEGLSDESIREIFDCILEKSTADSSDQTEWEALKARFAAKLTASQIENLVVMPEYESYESFFIFHNQAHEDAAFKLMKEDNLKQLAGAIREWSKDPLMAKFVSRLKSYAAKKREITGDHISHIIKIFDALQDPVLESELCKRLDEKSLEAVLDERILNKSWDNLVLFAGNYENDDLFDFIACKKDIQGLTPNCALKVIDLLGIHKNKFFLRIKNHKELLDIVLLYNEDLKQLFEEKVDSTTEATGGDLQRLSWDEAIAVQAGFKGIQARQGKEFLASLKSLDSITPEQVTYIVTELFELDAALQHAFVKRLEGQWEDLLKNAPDQRVLLVNNQLFLMERFQRGLTGLLDDLASCSSSEKFCRTLTSKFLINHSIDGESAEDVLRLYQEIIKFNSKSEENKFFEKITLKQLEFVIPHMDNQAMILLITDPKTNIIKKRKLLDLIDLQNDEERKTILEGLRNLNEGLTIHNSLTQRYYQKLISPELETFLTEDESAILELIGLLQTDDSESNRELIIKQLDVKSPNVRRAGILQLSALDAEFNFNFSFKEWLDLYKDMGRVELIQLMADHPLLENQAKAIAYILWKQTITNYDCNGLLMTPKSKYFMENIKLIKSLDVPYAKAVALWFTKGNPKLNEFSLDCIKPKDIYALDVNSLYSIDQNQFPKMSVESLIFVLRRVKLSGNNRDNAEIFLRVIKYGLTDKWNQLTYKDAKFIYKEFIKYKSKLFYPYFKSFLLQLKGEVFSLFLSKKILNSTTPWNFLVELFKTHYESLTSKDIVEFLKIKLMNGKDTSKCTEMASFLQNKLSDEEFAELFNINV